MIAKRQAAALPHTGIATFCKAPYVFDPTEMNADVAVLGIPFDTMASMRPGCRQAPRALRDASTRFGWLGDDSVSSGYFDIGQNATLLSGVRIVDAGDVDVRLDAAVTRERTTSHARSIIDRGLRLASIGGDHSVSFPLLAAFEKFGPLTVVLLDAHLDYRDKSMDMKFTNNSPFRRIHELPFVKRIATIGVRGIKSTDREYRESWTMAIWFPDGACSRRGNRRCYHRNWGSWELLCEPGHRRTRSFDRSWHRKPGSGRIRFPAGQTVTPRDR